MTVLYNWSLICAFYHRFSFFHTFIDISDKIIGACQNIVLLVEMDRRMASLHGFTWMDLNRIFLIFHFDQFQCPGCRDLVLCDNCRNIITIITDTSRKKIPVCHILVRRFYWPWMSRCRITVLRHILKSHNFDNPFQRFCFTCVDGCHDTISDRCMQHFGDQTSRRYQILCKFGSSGYLFICVYTRNAFSYHNLSPACFYCKLWNTCTYFLKNSLIKRAGSSPKKLLCSPLNLRPAPNHAIFHFRYSVLFAYP